MADMNHDGRLLMLVLAAALAGSGCSTTAAGPTVATATPISGPCPVTTPPPVALTPPPTTGTGPNPTLIFRAGPDSFLYGNDALLVLLPNDAVLRPSDRQRGLSSGVKLPWWRVAPGDLTIATKRLDGTTTARTTDVPGGYGDTGFQPSGIYFDAPGCWQVTGTAGGKTLTFVMNVAAR